MFPNVPQYKKQDANIAILGTAIPASADVE
jgi:hypothetical protein